MDEHAFPLTGFLWLGSAVRYTVISGAGPGFLKVGSNLVQILDFSVIATAVIECMLCCVGFRHTFFSPMSYHLSITVFEKLAIKALLRP